MKKKEKNKTIETNLVMNLETIVENVVITQERTLSVSYPYKTYNFSKILLRNFLNYFGKDYRIISEDLIEGGIVYHTNLPVKEVLIKDPKTELRIKVMKGDIKHIGTWEMENGLDQTLFLLCYHNCFKIQKTLLQHILRCIGPDYKITKVKKYSDYMGIWTNLPYSECKNIMI